MPATVRDIAERTGLSASTVGQILNTSRRGLFSQATQEIVLAAARELSYRPHAHARAMVSGRLGAVGLLLGHGSGQSTLTEDLLRGLMCSLAEHDLSLVIAHVADERLADPDYVPKMVREYAVDAMLVNYTHGVPARTVDLIRSHVPAAIWLNCKLDTNCVRPDDFGAAADLTRRLIRHGHLRIAYVNYSTGWKTIDGAHYSQRDRQSGYEAAMRESGLEPLVYMHDQFVAGRRCEEVSREMLQLLRPTAVIAQSEKVGNSVLFAARALGMEAPRDFSLACFMRIGRTEPLGVPVTGVIEPGLAIARAATEMVLATLHEAAGPMPARVVPFEFYQGVTDGAAPAV
jgi:LacI family transcriptional regulator